MKHGIYYTNGEMFVLIGSEVFDAEDRAHFTHVEFWEQGNLLQKSVIKEFQHEVFDYFHLVLLSKNPNWPDLIKGQLVS